MPKPATPVMNGAELFDINDPPFNYHILIPDPQAPKAPVQPATTLTSPPVVQPVQTTQPVQPAPVAVTPAAPTSEPAPSTPQPKHPKWLTDMAEQQGLHPLVLERLPTEEVNRIVIETMNRQLAERSQSSAIQAIQAPPQAPVIPGLPTPTQQAVAAVATQPPSAPQQPSFDWGMHPDVDDRTGLPTAARQYTDADINPAIAAHIKKLAARTEELESFIKTMGQQVSQTQEQKIEAEFDASFNKYPAVFGQGNAKALAGKPEFERRKAVFQAVKGMYHALPAAARGSITIDSAVASMAQTLFGVQTQAAAPAAQPVPPTEPSHPGQGFVGGAVAVPTQRRAANLPPGRDAAVQAAVDWWGEQKGQGADPDAGTSMNEFLG